MFKLIKSEVTNATYYRQLVTALREVQRQASEFAPSDAVIAVRLNHTVQFVKDVSKSVGLVRYNKSFKSKEGLKDPQSHTEALVEGVNYSFGPLDELITAAVADARNTMAEFLDSDITMEKEDICDRVQHYILSTLESLNVFEGFNVSTSVMYGEITQVTVTVA